MDPADVPLVPDAIRLLKDPGEFQWRITIQPDSLSQTDYTKEKQERIEFLTAVSTYMEKAVVAVQQLPQLLPLTVSLLKFGIAGFRVGKDIEGAVDRALAQIEGAVQQQMNQPKPPSPEQVKAQATAQKSQADIQNTRMRTQAEVASTAMKTQAEIRSKNAKLAGEIQRDRLKTAHQAQQQAIKNAQTAMGAGPQVPPANPGGPVGPPVQ
jgi:hypothetical protein